MAASWSAAPVEAAEEAAPEAAAGIGRAACQGQHTGGSHHTHQRNKGSAFHRNILSVKMFV
jgi:hypothetical protein